MDPEDMTGALQEIAEFVALEYGWMNSANALMQIRERLREMQELAGRHS